MYHNFKAFIDSLDLLSRPRSLPTIPNSDMDGSPAVSIAESSGVALVKALRSTTTYSSSTAFDTLLQSAGQALHDGSEYIPGKHEIIRSWILDLWMGTQEKCVPHPDSVSRAPLSPPVTQPCSIIDCIPYSTMRIRAAYHPSWSNRTLLRSSSLLFEGRPQTTRHPAFSCLPSLS